MSQPQQQPKKPKKKGNSFLTTQNLKVIFFIIMMCFVSSLILAITAFTLKTPQEEAKELDRSKQMLIAAKILTHEGYFILTDEEGKSTAAKYDSSNDQLVAVKKEETIPKATTEQIKDISTKRIRPLLTDNQGQIYTLKEKNLDISQYLSENKKAGYANLPLKLFYVILPNELEKAPPEEDKEFQKVYGYIFPISGFGLWAPIYGYLALAPNADRVIGTSWYEHAETPGLGANIVEAWWQKQFFGKLIFQEAPSGKTDFQSAPIGIIVVKGKVKDVYGNTPKAQSAVDGMSGATLTGDGVTAAYRDSLNPYRSLLIKLHDKSEIKNKSAHG